MKLFDERYKRTAWPYGSGVWGKREWVAPEVPDDADRLDGRRAARTCSGPSATASQLGLRRALGEAVRQQPHRVVQGPRDDGARVGGAAGDRAKGSSVRAIACASTGDTSASLAAYGAAAGLPVVVLLPRGKVSTAQLVQPIANGALVLSLDTDFDGCMAIVQRLADRGLVYLANSMNALRLEGQKTVAIEIVQQFDWQVPDWIVLPERQPRQRLRALRGLPHDEGARHHRPLPAARASRRPQRANPLYRAWTAGQARGRPPVKAKPTLATAIQIGNPVSAPRAMRALEAMNGVVEQATEEELCRRRGARRSHGHVHLPAHRGRARGAREAGRARRHRQEGARGGGLDRERPQVHRVQGALPRAHARGAELVSGEPADRAARRLRQGGPGHRSGTAPTDTQTGQPSRPRDRGARTSSAPISNELIGVSKPAN